MAVSAIISPALSEIPPYFSSGGGEIAFDNEYFYVKYNGWRRFPLCTPRNIPRKFPSPTVNGHFLTDNEYFYIVANHRWMRSPEFVIKPRRPILPLESNPLHIKDTKLTTFPRGTDNYGRWGLISFNAEYFCVWGQGKWHKIAIGRMPSRPWLPAVGPILPPPSAVPILIAFQL